MHRAVETLGHLLALQVTPANVQDRTQVAHLAEQVQDVTGDAVELASVDQGYTRAQAARAAEAHSLQLKVVKLSEAQQGFVLLPEREVVERSCGWAGRCRCLAQDYEQLAATLACTLSPSLF